ncbi:MAG: preprotein translocase subunit SecG [Verrucomicrobiota bacterium]
MSILISLLTVVLIMVCLLLIVIVMMQRPKQEGLGAAFGGGMTDQMFGAQTTNVLQKGTVYLAVLFFVLSLLLAILMAKEQGRKASLPEGLTESDPLPALEAPSTGITIDEPMEGLGEGADGAAPGAADTSLDVPSVMLGGEGEGEGAGVSLDGGEEEKEDDGGKADEAGTKAEEGASDGESGTGEGQKEAGSDDSNAAVSGGGKVDSGITGRDEGGKIEADAEGNAAQ